MPKTGHKQSPEHKRKRSEAMQGEGNPAYKDGRRSYRAIAGSEENDGSVVHHKDGDRTNNDPKNLERLTDGKRKQGRKTTPKHEEITRRASKDREDTFPATFNGGNGIEKFWRLPKKSH
jgi:hypothetical protein